MASEEAYEALADEYKRVLDALGDQARHRFEALASKLDLRGPAARDRLVDALGVVVEGYADQATAAAEMYLQGLQGLGEAITWTAAEPPDPRQIESIVGRALGEAGRGDVAGALARIADQVARLATQSARNTVGSTRTRARAGGRRELWARIPRGKTCAWCTMLASRGYVYTSWLAAGATTPAGNGSSWHPDDDCQIVSNKERSARSRGYDPERMRSYYDVAKHAAGPGADDRAVAAELRALFPSAVTDGKSPVGRSRDGTLHYAKYHEHRRALAELLRQMPTAAREGKLLPPLEPPEAPTDWPRTAPAITARDVNHILYGDLDRKGKFTGGHLHGHGWAAEGPHTTFPESWTADDVLDRLGKALAGAELRRGTQEVLVDGHRVRVFVRVFKTGQMQVRSVYPVG